MEIFPFLSSTTPAIWPSITFFKSEFSLACNCSLRTVPKAPVARSLETVWYPVTMTSPSTLASSSITMVVALISLDIGIVCVFMPTNETLTTLAFIPLFKVKTNLPFTSVTVPVWAPGTKIATPTSGSFCSSVTVPRIVRSVCAHNPVQAQIRSTKSIIKYFLVINNNIYN